jgi:hypothetical protein
MKTKTKLRARRMWANYYADGRIAFFKQQALASLMKGFANAETVPVAVIPLHDTDKMINTAFEAYWTAWALNSATCQQSMRAALTAIGVLPRAKKGRK